MQILFRPDIWIDHSKTNKGYEIPLKPHFYVFTPSRPLEEIITDLKHVNDRILETIGGLSA